MSNLRKLARGQECLIRVPTVCNGDVTTTVLCHIRMIELSGTGIKAPDVFATFGCSACHAVCDGQQKSEYSYSERRLMLLEGMVRYQLWLLDRGDSEPRTGQACAPAKVIQDRPTARSWLKFIWLLLTREWDL
jgi:hypothetical protein